MEERDYESGLGGQSMTVFQQAAADATPLKPGEHTDGRNADRSHCFAHEADVTRRHEQVADDLLVDRGDDRQAGIESRLRLAQDTDKLGFVSPPERQLYYVVNLGIVVGGLGAEIDGVHEMKHIIRCADSAPAAIPVFVAEPAE